MKEYAIYYYIYRSLLYQKIQSQKMNAIKTIINPRKPPQGLFLFVSLIECEYLIKSVSLLDNDVLKGIINIPSPNFVSNLVIYRAITGLYI